MLTSSALVLMMSIPGLALFYGGMVRTKNMASILSQVFAIVAMVAIVWCLYGYSLAFTEGSHQLVPFAGGDHPWLGFLEGYQWNNLVGGFDRAFLKGMTPDSNVPTFSNGVVIPEYAYMVFQMTFAIITPALIIGSFAERMKFSAVFVFILLWVTFIYFPDRAWRLVLGGSGRDRRCREGPGRCPRRCRQGGRAGESRRGSEQCRLFQ